MKKPPYFILDTKQFDQIHAYLIKDADDEYLYNHGIRDEYLPYKFGNVSVCEAGEFKNGYAVVQIGKLQDDFDTCAYYYSDKENIIIDGKGRVVTTQRINSENQIIDLGTLLDEIKVSGANIISFAEPKLVLAEENAALLESAMEKYLDSIKTQSNEVISAEIDNFEKQIESVKESVQKRPRTDRTLSR